MSSESNSNDSPFRPTATLQRLRQRADLLARVRNFFTNRGFWEVETPALSPESVIDRYLEPIQTVSPVGSRSEAAWLQTSPELYMKCLLASGAEAIFQVARAFRRDEVGPLHNPEFTMIEWYRVGDNLETGMTLLSEFAEVMLPFGKPQTISYSDAFLQAVGVDGLCDETARFESAAKSLGIDVPESMHVAERTDVDAWRNLLMAACVEPWLAKQSQPSMVFDYPASQAALAQTRHVSDTLTVSSRFELYAKGIELANGYHELRDPDELARRQKIANRQRLAEGHRELPEPTRLVAAMRHGLPNSVGVALGFDRLAMLALEANSIHEVLAFPYPTIRSADRCTNVREGSP